MCFFVCLIQHLILCIVVKRSGHFWKQQTSNLGRWRRTAREMALIHVSLTILVGLCSVVLVCDAKGKWAEGHSWKGDWIAHARTAYLELEIRKIRIRVCSSTVRAIHWQSTTRQTTRTDPLVYWFNKEMNGFQHWVCFFRHRCAILRELWFWQKVRHVEI